LPFNYSGLTVSESYDPQQPVNELSETGDPFGAGPFGWAHQSPQLAVSWQTPFWRRTTATVLIAWVPVVVLSALESLWHGSPLRESALFDPAALGRYLVAAPAFACVGKVALPQFAYVVREFRTAGLIPKRHAARYDALVASTKRVLVSRWTDALLLSLAYGLTLATSSQLYPPATSTWVTPAIGGTVGRLSVAGWWRLLVSQPLFYTLFAMWLLRLALWTRFIWRTTRLDLNLVAAHPDLLGGLRFVLVPMRGFSILAFAFGAITAGSVAASVLHGQPLFSFRYLIGSQVLGVLVLLAGPALLMTGPLVRLQDWGTFHYGRLASTVGHAFERRWLGAGRPSDVDALSAQDFSATTDLYQVVSNVRQINPFAVDLRNLIVLTVATLLPYVPVVLLVMPLDEILEFAFKAIS
jgi:hypothetical protein